MNTIRHPITDARFTGWSDDYHPTPLPIILPPKPKNPIESGFVYQIPHQPIYNRNYSLIFPNDFEHQQKHQFSYNTPHQNAFSDAWIKP